MVKDESFLLLSLTDSKAKKVAQVVSNESCKKILDYLAKTKSATETQISKELNIPLPTAHYNLKQLVEVKLVDINEYHYSEKGKEVNHYSLANKYIIIAPRQDSSSMMDKLKKIFPAFGLIAATSLIIKYFQSRPVADTAISAKMAVDEAAPSLMMATDVAPEIASNPDLALWFFLGGVSALLVYIIVDYLKSR